MKHHPDNPASPCVPRLCERQDLHAGPQESRHTFETLETMVMVNTHSMQGWKDMIASCFPRKNIQEDAPLNECDNPYIVFPVPSHPKTLPVHHLRKHYQSLGHCEAISCPQANFSTPLFCSIYIQYAYMHTYVDSGASYTSMSNNSRNISNLK